MHAHELDNLTAHPSAAAQGLATVLTTVPSGGYQIDLGGHGCERHAKRAASCLLEPGVGDRVWVVGEAGEGFYVLAVLERGTAGVARLYVEGDATLTASGHLELRADEGVALATPKALTLTSDELQVQARSGRMTFGEFAAVAKSVFATLARVTHVGQVLDLIIDKVTQRSKHSVRSIEGIDHTRAEHIDLEASTNVHINAKHALINGHELVKLDGDQIHLG